MRFGFICPPYLGHLNPMMAIAAELCRRGHQVSFLGLAALEPVFRGRPYDLVPLGSAEPFLELHTLKASMAAPRGLGLFRIMRDMARMTDMICREAPAVVRSLRIDALVVDQLEPAGGLVAEHLGLPFVSVANALPIDREPTVPPPFTAWRYDPSSWGVQRNIGGYRVADAMMGRIGQVVSRWCATWNLPKRQRLDQCLSRLAQVGQIVPGFDFPRNDRTGMHLCGPFRDAEIPPGTEPVEIEQPFVYASLGTLQGSRYDLFRRVAEACHRSGIRAVVAHGGGLTAAQERALPGNPVVRRFVDQRALLGRATLAVTNGGLNTVLDALAAAVPVVVVPIAFEQGAIGARLEACGAGISVPLSNARTARLEAAIRRATMDQTFGAAAARLAAEIAGRGGAVEAADTIEAAVTAALAVTA